MRPEFCARLASSASRAAEISAASAVAAPIRSVAKTRFNKSLMAGSYVSGRKCRAFTEEIFFHLLEEKFLCFRRP